ncbi:MAG TPA: hypothetical protein HPP58_00690 [Deltaproteobacteria bacterium]|nr:hypothetical protein [Deltaproteobacteria bacterium]HIJ39655.1 hypothetical protein [Deltaproteobacteria bacterium]
MFTALKEKLHVKSEESLKKADWLAKILGIYGDALPEIRAGVNKMMETNDHFQGGEQTATDRQSMARRVSGRLIRQAAMKTGVMGGITAAPFALPGIGMIGTAVAGISADFTYLIRKQVWLCYGISAAYDVRLQEEELKAVILAILGFSGTGQLGKEIAVRALKEMVDAGASRFLRKGLIWSASEVAAIITPRLFRKSYRVVPFLSMPLSASVNIASTITVGNHAREYFSSEDTAAENR